MNSIHSLHPPGMQSSLHSSPLRSEAVRGVPVPATPVPVTDKETRKVAAVIDGQETHSSRSEAGNNKQLAADDVGSGYSNKKADEQLQLLNAAERKQVQELSQRDREVKAHESAHLAAAGQHATSGARYTYTRGPDGASYAIGGSVGIDTGAEANPEATLRKADQIKRAALAPAEPSGQDRSVAAAATLLRQQAQAEIVTEQAQERSENFNEDDGDRSNESGDVDARNDTGLSTDSDNKQKSPGSVLELEIDFKKDDHDNGDSASGTCDMCGGSHGSEGHLAANKAKLESSYQVNSGPQDGRDTPQLLSLFA